MNPLFPTLIATAREKGYHLAFITAGGGATLFELFKVPGCSRVLTEARMLYSQESFAAFLGHPLTGHHVSQQTADLLAMRLYAGSESNLCVALTCALSTDRKRKGKDHGYLSLCSQNRIVLQRHLLVSETNRELQDLELSEAVIEGLHHFISTYETVA